MKLNIQTPLPKPESTDRPVKALMQFQEWLRNAPLANLEEVASKVTTEVHLANRSDIPSQNRLEMLEACTAAIEEMQRQYFNRFSLSNSCFFF